MKFNELGLIAPILKALHSQGYEHPTPIQAGAIPPALAGRDVLGCAQTGTGKTCAFATPILQRLHGHMMLGHRHIRALILTPTRELALQIQECFEDYGQHLGLRSAVIFGGVGQAPQVDKIRRGLDILVATPGRLLDLQNQKLLDLSHVELFVLDEADRMLDMGFIHDVRKVLKVLPTKKQTLFFSATMPPEVMDLVHSLLHNPVKVEVDPVSSPVEVIEQSVYFVDKGNKSKLLAQILREKPGQNALVFTRTKHGANRVVTDLEKNGLTAAAIHGNKSQTARQQALANFKSGKLRVLVATDIAARGIDIEELPLVFNYNLPEVPETYVHRIGRTGRAGHEGTAIAFCDFAEKDYLKSIEKLIGRKLPVSENSTWPMQVFSETKDARGRTVNAEDEDARAAARERKKLRDSAKAKTASAPPAKAPKEKAQPKQAKQGRQQSKATATAPSQPAPTKKRSQKWEKAAGDRASRLDTVLPERGASSTPPVDYSQRRRPNPLGEDRIMDATARLLAPRPRMFSNPPEQRKAEPSKSQSKPKRTSSAKKTQPKTSAPVKQEPVKQNKPSHPTKSNSRTNGTPTQSRRNDRNSRPPRGPVMAMKSGRVKDSTEQPSLMKPYYLGD